MRCAGRSPGAAVLHVEGRAPRALEGNRPAEPAKARDEDELELRDDRALESDEEIVEATVLEVILDAGPSDPADPPVDDHGLAVVDVSERDEVPAHRPTATAEHRRADAAWSRA